VLELFEIDWTDDTLVPRSVEGVLEAMAETDKEEGPSAWLRASVWVEDSDDRRL